jgi:hypothetical protein
VPSASRTYMRPPSVSTTSGVSLLLLARNSFAWRLPLL